MSFSEGKVIMADVAVQPWRWPKLYVILLLWLRVASFSPVTALHVVPGSNCTGVCSQGLDAANTATSDVTCYDEDYNSTDVGRQFRDCVSCEMQSRTFDHQSTQTDLGWALCRFCYFQITEKRSFTNTDFLTRQYEICRGYLHI